MGVHSSEGPVMRLENYLDLIGGWVPCGGLGAL